MRKEVLSYDEMLNILKPAMFGFENMLKEKSLLKELHISMNAAFNDSENDIKEFAKTLGLSEKANQMFSGEEFTQRIDEFKKQIPTAVEHTFKTFSLKKNGFCLKTNLIGCAVQMRLNPDMLGFIKRLDGEGTRFVFVDFGGAEEEVKIDIDELNIAETLHK